MRKRERKGRRLSTKEENNTPAWMKKHKTVWGISFLFLLAVLCIAPLYIAGKSGEKSYQESVAENTNRKFGMQGNESPKQQSDITVDQFKKYIAERKIFEFSKQKDETTDSYILRGEISETESRKLILSSNRYNTDLERFLQEYPYVKIKHLKTIPLKKSGGFNFFWILPFVLIFFIIRWVLSRRNGGKGADSQFNNMKEHGKAKIEIIEPGDINVSFKDVAGCDEAIEDLREIVSFLINPEKFNYLGGKMPKGVLLVGFPGCGKTLLAKAVAGETNVPFLSITGADFAEAFVGIGPARIRDMFKQAREKAPCIIFIDEIDSVGKSRGTPSSHSEKEDTLNKLLAEMDGFRRDNPVVVVLAATNRPDQLDPALLRPGRFDRQVVVDKPDIVGREAILKIHAKGIKIADKKDLKIVAKRTPGLSGADLANIINEAALLAAKRNKQQVELQDFLDGIARAMTGQEQRSKQLSEEEKNIVAIHEVGHAIAQFYTDDNAIIHKISIIKSGRGALGYTLTLPKEDRNLMNQEDLKNIIIGLLGGRAAENIILKSVTTGAQNDLERATEIARKYVSTFGMDSDIGLLSYGKANLDYLGNVGARGDYSEKTAVLIDKKMKELVDECYKKAEETIKNHLNKAEELIEKIKESETLETGEIAKILKK